MNKKDFDFGFLTPTHLEDVRLFGMAPVIEPSKIERMNEASRRVREIHEQQESFKDEVFLKLVRLVKKRDGAYGGR